MAGSRNAWPPGASEVNSDPNPHEPCCKKNCKRVLTEGALVALVGLAVALAANGFSPRRLRLDYNYFPTGTNDAVASPRSAPRSAGTANQISIVERLIEEIKAKGLHPLNREQVVNLFNDPRARQDLVVFLDARNEDHYKAGHIPRAYEFDAFRTEKQVGTVFPKCQMAEEIVLYCNGGDCEDSQFAAIALRTLGVENQKLFIYVGGMMDWATNGLPVEIGERNSGNLRNTGQ
jgi:rhodanese-related sulfurtransferase